MKAKDMFNTIFQIEELTKEEFLSIIWSNPVNDDFISAMCALMEFFPYNENLTKHNKDLTKKCPKCMGAGKLKDLFDDSVEDCPDCKGSGISSSES